MTFILIATSVLLGASIVLLFVLQGGLSRKRRAADGFWRRFLRRQLLVLPILLFVIVPGLLGLAAAKLVRTRHDEAGYQGPVFAAGEWQIQSRHTLKHGTPEGDVVPAVRLENADGPKLIGYYIPAPVETPKATVLLVHGLFRSAMEVEPVAEMFRDLGADVFLLNLRNHGGSDFRTFTFGFEERADVLAGVRYLRAADRIRGPLIVFGVSMGAVAAARAAPEIPELRGLVLDAPMTDLVGTVHRQLGSPPLRLPSIYTSLVTVYMELFCGFDMEAVRPVEQIAALPPGLHTLFVGAGRDRRVPPEIVRAVHAARQAPADRKALWIQPDARHGRAFLRDPDGYRAQLAAFLARVTAR